MSSFPKLLHKSNIATYDPLISRIYTSTPSSAARHGDFGVKYAIQRTKGPRYMKFPRLDGIPRMGFPWRSGEREARFIEAWGSGRVHWVHRGAQNFLRPEDDNGMGGGGVYGDDRQRQQHKDAFFASLVDRSEETAVNKEWVHDVESLSEAEFERYLKEIRSARKAWLAERLEALPPSSREELVNPEDHTLVHLASASKVSSQATRELRARITAKAMHDSKSDKLYAQPHETHGLMYTKTMYSSSSGDVATSFPGRVLNRVNKFDEMPNRAMSRDTNVSWVADAAGMTGRTSTTGGRVSSQELADSANLAPIDYTREDKAQGTARFKIKLAKINAPPTAVDLSTRTIAARWAYGHNRMQKISEQASPLDTFRFDVLYDVASEEPVTTPVGSREWVAREPSKPMMLTPMGSGGTLGMALGLGDKRKAATDASSRREDRVQSLERITSLLQRAVKANKE
ncbi:hypothetical protein IAT38_008186 [Cryptococcus sp. DSM 104549]